jgi:4-amino-4-deoxy-L-arabinose transferase-like glycosyltransferase
MLGLLFVFSIPFWLNVGVLPFRIWDESRNAINAIEMYQSGDLIVRTYKGSPETYELKPPLLIWLQVACLHLFGLNELAIRFPSVFFSILSLVLVFMITYSSTKKYWSGVFAVGILTTSFGFYGDHVGRFGDHDATLAFFVLLLAYSTFRFIKTEKPAHLYLMGVSLTLGVLCKSIAVLMIGPGLFFALLFHKKLAVLLSNKHFYISVFSGLFTIGLYYWQRELRQPGYLNLVWQGELFPRYVNRSSNYVFEEYSFFYYFKLLFKEQMQFWFWLISAVIITPFVVRGLPKSWTFWTIQCCSFLLVISLGTKNFWYVAPTIPMLAIVFSNSVHLLISHFKKNTEWLIIPVMLILFFPYKKAYRYALNPHEKYYELETNGISHYLKDELNLKHLSSNTKILLDQKSGLEPHLFYVNKLKIERGFSVPRAQWNKIKQCDTLLVSHLSSYVELKKFFNMSIIDSSYNHTKLLSIDSVR